MRTVRSLLAPALILGAVLAAAPAAAQSKIGSIDTPVLLRDAPQTKAAEAKFKAEFDKRNQDLQAERKKWQDDYKKAQREADAMSPQQKAAAEQDLFNRKSNLDLKERQLNEQAQQRNAELQRELLTKIGKAIEDVAREKGLDLIVRDPAFVGPGIDVTPDVLKKLAALPDAPAAAPKKKK